VGKENATLKSVLALVLTALLSVSVNAQHLGSARGIGIGAYTSVVDELGALDWNPAGLSRARDWELSSTSAIPLGSGSRVGGLIFQTLGGTKRLLENHTFGIRYSPGFTLDFVVPSTFQFANGGQSVSFDKKISFKESYALGYGYQLSSEAAIGVSARYLEESLTDTEPFFEKDTIARIRFTDYFASSWNFDLGIQWTMNARWHFGIVAKNLFRMKESEFPHEARDYSFRPVKTMRFGLSYQASPYLTTSLDLDSRRRGAAGVELNITRHLQLRQGMFFGREFTPFVAALSTSVGWRSESVQLDVGYVHFLGKTRGSEMSLQEFLTEGVKDISANQYMRNQFIATLRVPLSIPRESMAKIEQVRIMSEVYPSSHYVHAHRPLGIARVRNISSKPIEARVSFFVEQYMDAPTETSSYVISPDGTADIPLVAIFNDAVKFLPSVVLRAADVVVKASPHTGYDDKVQTRVVFRGKNDWDGDVLTLRYFVTPDDPEVLRFTRRVMNEHKDELAATEKEVEKLASAKKLFDEFASRLTYVRDPKLSKDRVQFPSETLALRGGDCDDLAVSYASLLASVGISTAFVDVVPPGDEEDAHIYLMLDTGVPPANASLVSSNPKRYVVRRDFKGRETIWVPIESTMMAEGFERAWEIGAETYFQDVEAGSGLTAGWVRIVDVLSR